VAAKNTEQLLSDAQQQSENGVLVSTEVSRIFRQIVDEIKKLSTLIAEVATANHEQAQGIDQINTAIVRVDQVTQTNAAHAAEAAASNEKLSSQARELGRLANSLVAIVSGRQG
jgi:methyl-accepting chemotaxis protein